ncbi:hypothetical protein LUZ60_009229 [Juncus effusus]|nr:hypothetical protein LUZ60_009229 [Juncus effusus]
MAYLHYIFSVLLLLLFQLRQVNSCSIKDFQSLLAFKHDVTDPLDRLSSWKGKNCCLWEGVTCNNKTGRVIHLDLHNPASDDDHWSLGGEISQSLIGLDFLTYLDLSFNEFEDISIPKFFGSFQSLRYLNLSAAGFEGSVPPHLGNLSALRQLDLSHNTFLTIHDSRWVTKLNSLEYLDLTDLIFTEKSEQNYTHQFQTFQASNLKTI